MHFMSLGGVFRIPGRGVLRAGPWPWGHMVLKKEWQLNTLTAFNSYALNLFYN